MKIDEIKVEVSKVSSIFISDGGAVLRRRFSKLTNPESIDKRIAEWLLSREPSWREVIEKFLELTGPVSSTSINFSGTDLTTVNAEYVEMSEGSTTLSTWNAVSDHLGAKQVGVYINPEVEGVLNFFFKIFDQGVDIVQAVSMDELTEFYREERGLYPFWPGRK